MSKNRLDEVYDRLIAMMDDLRDDKIKPEQAEGIADGAEKIAKLMVIETQLIDIAWSNNRNVTPSAMIGSVIDVEPDRTPRLTHRGKPLNGG